MVVVIDDDVNVRDWQDVIWALTTRVDPARDTLLVESTPIDYLDFASPVSGLGSKMGIDATNKWPGETTRAWGKPIAMDAAVKARVDAIYRTQPLAANRLHRVDFSPPKPVGQGPPYRHRPIVRSAPSP